MKILFIPALRKANLDLEKLKEIEKILPEKIHITYTIQYKRLAEKILTNLKKSKKILGFSQVLGCSNLKTKAQAFLLISDGKFHALNLLSSGKEVYIFPGMEKLSIDEVEKMKKIDKSKYLKFLYSKEIGILVSTKKNQENIKKALQLKNQTKNKKSYIFLADNININELENFPLDLYINTACPGLMLDSKKILNCNLIKK